METTPVLHLGVIWLLSGYSQHIKHPKFSLTFASKQENKSDFFFKKSQLRQCCRYMQNRVNTHRRHTQNNNCNSTLCGTLDNGATIPKDRIPKTHRSFKCFPTFMNTTNMGTICQACMVSNPIRWKQLILRLMSINFERAIVTRFPPCNKV